MLASGICTAKQVTCLRVYLTIARYRCIKPVGPNVGRRERPWYSMQVPVIDLSQGEEAAAAEVRAACLNSGFFYGRGLFPNRI